MELVEFGHCSSPPVRLAAAPLPPNLAIKVPPSRINSQKDRWETGLLMTHSGHQGVSGIRVPLSAVSHAGVSATCSISRPNLVASLATNGRRYRLIFVAVPRKMCILTSALIFQFHPSTFATPLVRRRHSCPAVSERLVVVGVRRRAAPVEGKCDAREHGTRLICRVGDGASVAGSLPSEKRRALDGTPGLVRVLTRPVLYVYEVGDPSSGPQPGTQSNP